MTNMKMDSFYYERIDRFLSQTVTLSMSCGENRYCVILFALFRGNRSPVIFVSYKLSSFLRDPSFRLILC